MFLELLIFIIVLVFIVAIKVLFWFSLIHCTPLLGCFDVCIALFENDFRILQLKNKSSSDSI